MSLYRLKTLLVTLVCSLAIAVALAGCSDDHRRLSEKETLDYKRDLIRQGELSASQVTEFGSDTRRTKVEIDSLYNLHYVMDWFSNRTTPYEFAYSFVPFWELTYVPGFVFEDSQVTLEDVNFFRVHNISILSEDTDLTIINCNFWFNILERDSFIQFRRFFTTQIREPVRQVTFISRRLCALKKCIGGRS